MLPQKVPHPLGIGLAVLTQRPTDGLADEKGLLVRPSPAKIKQLLDICLRSLAQLGDERLLAMLLEQGRVVRVGDGIVYRSEDFDNIELRVRDYLVDSGSITLAEARDLFSTSRRYAQAILEELDARGVTRRVGDERVLRAGGPA